MVCGEGAAGAEDCWAICVGNAAGAALPMTPMPGATVTGCTAVLISAQDPNAVRFLATAVFVESSPR